VGGWGRWMKEWMDFPAYFLKFAGALPLPVATHRIMKASLPPPSALYTHRAGWFLSRVSSTSAQLRKGPRALHRGKHLIFQFGSGRPSSLPLCSGILLSAAGQICRQI
jgi:hypothetical protein